MRRCKQGKRYKTRCGKRITRLTNLIVGDVKCGGGEKVSHNGAAYDQALADVLGAQGCVWRQIVVAAVVCDASC
jgi:hypothetical protein